MLEEKVSVLWKNRIQIEKKGRDHTLQEKEEAEDILFAKCYIE